ncbi:MAG: hypothetical protein U9R14_04705 [Patescibacteria group bacterium]|nr:hypothetical protein [Patescibacteria group bacterium]
MKKVIILAVVVIILAIAGYAYSGTKDNKIVLAPEEAQAKVEGFINNNLMQAGKKASIKTIIDEGDLYKVVVDIGSGKDIDSYITKDGKKFFPQVMDIEEIEKATAEKNNNTAGNQPPASAVSVKQDKPTVEIFVMSHCPFGTQIEKGVLPVLEILGHKIDFQLKFCDYAMHDKKELNEQLIQHCIQKEQSGKLISYLKCFLEKGESESCLSKTGINKNKLSSCVVATDRQYKVTEMYNDKTTWKSGRFPQFNVDSGDNKKYGIGGSPGFVINGVKMGESSCNSDSDCHTGEVCVNGRSGKVCSMPRNPESLKQAICATFNNPPDECNENLSADTPTPGFGFSGSSSNSSGSCE